MSQPAPTLRPRRLVAPLAPVAIAFASGIVLDRYGLAISTASWAALAVVASAFLFVRPKGLAGGFAVIAAFAALGGSWHHHRWSDLDADDLASGDWSSSRPAWVRGMLVENPRFRAGDWPDQDGVTTARMDVAGISDSLAWRIASGRVDLSIPGDRSDLAAGEPVFAAGTLGAIRGPLNPGESDRRDRERAQGVRLRLVAGGTSSVWPDPHGRGRTLARWLGRMRTRSYDLLVAGLAPDVANLAAALLLGRREGVDPDVNDAFARTGTTHLLAISGLHLQALAALLFLAFRLVGLGRRSAFVGVLIATVVYAVLVGLMPSVVRASAMTVVVCLAGLSDRCSLPANRLAAAAIATLTINPAYLFDAGCQLSFLAVMALFLGVPALFPRRDHRDPDDEPTPAKRLDALERKLEPSWKKAARQVLRRIAEGVAASAIVWAATAPLVALRFHIVAPIGILLNIPLIPITSLALGFAGLSMLGSMIWAPLAVPWAWACEGLLRWAGEIVAWGANRPEGWAFTAGPSVGMTLTFYAVLALASWATFRRWRGQRFLWGLLAAEAAMATFLLLVPGHPRTLEAEILAVDHGLAVVIQAADGRVYLYDCGKMRDPRVGRRIVAPALWDRGVRTIECVILSHADADHYGGLNDVLDRFAVNEVRVPPGFGGPGNPDAARLLDRLRSRRVLVRERVAGDHTDLGPGASATALHPPKGWLPTAPDNARSVVLDVRAEGRRLLLTGDLEGPGLSALAAAPSPQPDAMLSPHHGSRASNPEWLYRWAEPRRVIVSQARPKPSTRDPLAFLKEDAIPVDRTWERGAILLKFEPGGLAVRGFLDPPPTPPASPGGPLLATIGPLGPRVPVAIAGVLLGAGLCLALTILEWGAWTLILPGRRRYDREAEPPPWEPIEVIAADGATLRGAWLEPSGPKIGAIVFLHGFGEDRSGMRGRAEAMAHRGWAAAILDSRGRRESEGTFTAFGGFEAADVSAWLDALHGRAPRFLAWGRSMGAAVAARAAADDPRIAGLILEAPYADLGAAVAAWLGLMRLPKLFAAPMLARASKLAGVSLREPRPVAVARRVTIPTLILHGTADPVCLPAEVSRLAQAFAGPVEIIEVEGAKHGDVFDLGGSSLVERVTAWTSRS